MKKIHLYIIGLILLGLSALFVYTNHELIQIRDGLQSVPLSTLFSQDQKQYIATSTAASFDSGNVTATTTKTYLTVGQTASSTITGFMGNGKTLAMDIAATGSSSASTLGFSVDWSFNQVDWYREDVATTTFSAGTGTIFHAPIEIVHQQNLSTTTVTGNTIYKHLEMTGKPHMYYRIRLGTIGGNQAIHAEVYPTREL